MTIIIFIYFIIILHLTTTQKNDTFTYYCHENQTINLEVFKQLTTNLSSAEKSLLVIMRCRMSIPITDLIKSLKDANQTITALELYDVDGLDSKHLAGINETSVDFITLHFINEMKHPFPSNVFSLLSELRVLQIFLWKAENLPDLSYPQILQELKIYIAFTGVGNESLYANLLSNILKSTNDNIKTLKVDCSYVKKVSSSLYDDTFIGKSSLEKIDLSISIEHIDDHTFAHLLNLSELVLGDNKLKTFNTNFLPESLKILKLYGNQLTSFNIEKPFLHLEILDLLANRLTSFVLDMNYLPNLQRIDLSKNIIKYIKINNFIMGNNLTYIDLRSNDLRDYYMWQWAYDHLNQTEVNLDGNHPFCDCNKTDIINALNEKWKNNENLQKIVSCTATLPHVVSIPRAYLPCSEMTMENNTNCITYRSEFDWLIINCTKVANDSIMQHDIKSTVTSIDNIRYWYVKNSKFYLVLENNPRIKSLPNLTGISLFGKETFIYAENSGIASIHIDNVPKNELVDLRLANNVIQEIDMDVVERLSVMKTNLTLSGNPLICDCAHQDMYNSIISLQYYTLDFHTMKCHDGSSFDPDRVLCVSVLTILLYFSLSIAILITICLGIYLRMSLEVQVYIYSKGWFPGLFELEPDERQYEYDVFVSFSEKDETEVVAVLKILEKDQTPPFKVCYHHRDWIPGERIDLQIISSIDESRKTLVILSQNFLNSKWANMEFRTAHYKMLEEKSSRLVMIILDETASREDLPVEIQSYIKTNTYLKFGDKWFEKKLLFSVRRPNVKDAESQMRHEDLKK